MISRLYYIIEKNMKILIRSRGFIISVILAPLIITAIMGNVFSSNDINSIKIGIVDESAGKVSEDLLSNIDKSVFSFIYFNRIDECSESIIKFDTHACIHLDRSFNLSGEQKNTLYLYADYSKISLVWQVVNAITYSLSNSTEKESMNLVRNLLDQIGDYNDDLEMNSKKIAIITSNVEQIESKVLDSSKKLNDMDFGTESTVTEDLIALEEQIDSFKRALKSISDEQESNQEDMDRFLQMINENKDNLEAFETKFIDMKENMTEERNDCNELRSYSVQKHRQYHCENYALDNTSYDSDTSEMLYLKCGRVRDNLDVNLRDISDPIQTCYIINSTTSMSAEKITYLEQQIIELDSMIENVIKIQSDLETSSTYIDSFKANIGHTSSNLDKINSDLDKTKDDITGMDSKINTYASSQSNQVEDIKNELLLSLDDIVYSINLNNEDLGSIVDSFDEYKAANRHKNMSAEAVVTPIDIVIKPVTEKKSSFDYIAPILLAVMIAFSAVLIGAIISIHEKLSNSIKRNIICPTSDWLFIIGMYMTNMIVLLVETIVFMLMLVYFGTYVTTNVVSLAVALFVIGSAFTLCGMIIASFFNTEQSTILGALSFIILTMFFSEVLVPIERISSDLKVLSMFNPLNMSISILRKIILFGFDVSASYSQVYTLLIFSIICFANIYVLNYINSKR